MLKFAEKFSRLRGPPFHRSKTFPPAFTSRLFLLSGIRPGSSGTGRLIEFLQSSQSENQKLVFAYPPISLVSTLIKTACQLSLKPLKGWMQDWWHLISMLFNLLVFKRDHLVVLHPQTIGMFKSWLLICKAKAPVYWYVLDNSFFCRRSYNHLPQEAAPCLRCIGGQWEEAKKHHCKPFPNPNWFNGRFLKAIGTLARNGKIKFLCQNSQQEALVRAHFGPTCSTQVIGLWTSDFPSTIHSSVPDKKGYDIVFHASPHHAKGALWAYEVARNCSQLTFLFPFYAHELGIKNFPKNCTFRPMTWETGLKEEVIRARGTMVPSLWSAAIEGAVIKSIFFGKAVFSVNSDYSFLSEIPDDIVWKLPLNPINAAEALAKRLSVQNGLANDSRDRWLNAFISQKESVTKFFDGWHSESK